MRHIFADAVSADGTSPAFQQLSGLAFVCCALCLILAGVFLHAEHRKKFVPAVVLKGLASLCFVGLGLIGRAHSKDLMTARNVVTGLILGMIADVVLNLRYVLAKIGKKVFLAGILIFFSGHIFYIIALIPKCSSLPVCLAAAAVLTALLLKWMFSRITAAKAFKIFGVFYIGAIMVMTCMALGVLAVSPSAFSWIFSAGALMFLASDIILILNTFGPEQKESLRISNIVLYYIGQLLIASSLQFV